MYAIWKTNTVDKLYAYYPDNTGGIKPVIVDNEVTRNSNIIEGIQNYVCINIPSSDYTIHFDWINPSDPLNEAKFDGLSKTMPLPNGYNTTESGTVKIRGNFTNLRVTISNGDKVPITLNENSVMGIYAIGKEGGSSVKDKVGAKVNDVEWMAGNNNKFTVPQSLDTYTGLDLNDPLGGKNYADPDNPAYTQNNYYLKQVVVSNVPHGGNPNSATIDYGTQKADLGSIVDVTDTTKDYFFYPYFGAKNYKITQTTATEHYYHEDVSEAFDDARDKKLSNLLVLNDVYNKDNTYENGERIYSTNYDPSYAKTRDLNSWTINFVGNEHTVTRNGTLRLTSTTIMFATGHTGGITFEHKDGLSDYTKMQLVKDSTTSMNGGFKIENGTTASCFSVGDNSRFYIKAGTVATTSSSESEPTIISTVANSKIALGQDIGATSFSTNGASMDSGVLIENKNGYAIDSPSGDVDWDYGILKSNNEKYKAAYSPNTEQKIKTGDIDLTDTNRIKGSRRPIILISSDTSGYRYNTQLNVRMWRWTDKDSGENRQYYSNTLQNANDIINLKNNTIDIKATYTDYYGATISNDSANITKKYTIDYAGTNSRKLTINNCDLNIQSGTNEVTIINYHTNSNSTITVGTTTKAGILRFRGSNLTTTSAVTGGAFNVQKGTLYLESTAPVTSNKGVVVSNGATANIYGKITSTQECVTSENGNINTFTSTELVSSNRPVLMNKGTLKTKGGKITTTNTGLINTIDAYEATLYIDGSEVKSLGGTAICLGKTTDVNQKSVANIYNNANIDGMSGIIAYGKSDVRIVAVGLENPLTYRNLITEQDGPIITARGTDYNSTFGVSITRGKLILGNDETIPSVSILKPTIISEQRGVRITSGGEFEFYDGIIRSKIGKNKAIDGNVTKTPFGYDVRRILTEDYHEVATLVTPNYMELEGDPERPVNYYSNLKEALFTADSGNKIQAVFEGPQITETLPAEMPATLPMLNPPANVTKKLTLDLNGKKIILKNTLTNNGILDVIGNGELRGTGAAYTITNNNSFTMNGNGTITNGTDEGSTNTIMSLAGKVTVNSGKVLGTAGGIAIQNDSTLEVNGGEISSTDGYPIRLNSTGNSNIIGGKITSNGNNYAVYNQRSGVLTIGQANSSDGPTITGGINVQVAIGTPGNLIINSGTIKTVNQHAIFSQGNVKITGGKIDSSYNAVWIYGENTLFEMTGGEIVSNSTGIYNACSVTNNLKISGGKIKSKGCTIYTNVQGTSGIVAKPSIEIYGTAQLESTNNTVIFNPIGTTLIYGNTKIKGYDYAIRVAKTGSTVVLSSGDTATLRTHDNSSAVGQVTVQARKNANTSSETSGPEVTSTNGIGIYVDGGKLKLGNNENPPSVSSAYPSVTAKKEGIYFTTNGGTFEFYDGIITSYLGRRKAIVGMLFANITKPTGYQIQRLYDATSNAETATLIIPKYLEKDGTSSALVNYFASLNDAFNNAENNNIIEPIEDIGRELEATLPTGTNLKLNMANNIVMVGTITNNGTLTITGAKTLSTVSAINLITNKGTLNLSQTGKIINSNTGSYTTVKNTGTVNKNESGTVESQTSGYVIDGGTVNVSKGTIITNNGNGVNATGKFTMTNGTIKSYSGRCVYVNHNTSVVSTISGGNIIKDNSTGVVGAAIENNGSGILNATGGKVQVDNCGSNAVYNGGSGTININGMEVIQNQSGPAVTNYTTGTINISGTTKITSNAHGVVNTASGIINIGGGTITSNSTITGASALVNKGSTAAGNINVSGGTITATTALTNSGIGATTIYGTTSIKATSLLANITNGTVNVRATQSANPSSSTTGPTLTSQGTGVVINGTNAVFNLGVNESSPSVNTAIPKITANTVGVQKKSGTFNFYDGIIICYAGKDKTIVGSSISSLERPNNVPSGYNVQRELFNDREEAKLIVPKYEEWQSGYSWAVNHYSTLAIGTKSFKSGNTIKAIANVSEGATTLASGKTLILDLNGKTITMTGTLTNNGNLTISGSSGKLTASAVNTITNTGTLIKNGESTISNTGTSTVVISNSGSNNVTITAGKVTASGSTSISTSSTGKVIIGTSGNTSTTTPSLTGMIYGSSTSCGEIVVYSGKIAGTTKEAIMSKGSITINGGNISATGSYAVYTSSNANAKIKVTGGTITSSSSYTLTTTNSVGGKIEITGGTIKKTAGTSAAVNNYLGTTVITGGTIEATEGVGVYATSGTVTIGDNSNAVSKTVPNIIGKTYGVQVTSGTFNFYDGKITGKDGKNKSISKFPDDKPTGYEVQKLMNSDGSETATLIKANYAEYTGTSTTVVNYYETLNGALFSAIAGNRIEPLSNRTNEATATLPNKALTLKLTKNIQMAGTITNNGTLTISGTGTLSSTTGTFNLITNNNTLTKNESGVISSQTSGKTISGGTVTVNAGTVSTSNGTTISSTNVTITGGKVSSTSGACVYVTGTGKVTGGTLEKSGTTEGACFQINGSGSAKITGGTIQVLSNSGSNAIYSNSTGNLEIDGSGVVIQSLGSGNGGSLVGSGNIILKSGTIKSATKSGIYNIGTGTVDVRGGKIIGCEQGIHISRGGNAVITGGSIESESYGVRNATSSDNALKGSITLGTKGGGVSITNPEVIAKSNYGIVAGVGTFKFFDGVVVAQSGKTIHGTVTEKESGYVVTTAGSKTIGGTTYQTAVLGPSGPGITAKLDNASGAAYTSGTWTNHNVYVQLESSDKGSGIARYEWKEGSSGTWTQNYLTTSGGKGTITFNVDRNSVIYFRAIDTNGAISETKSITVKRDTAKPSCNIATNGGTSYKITVGNTTTTIKTKLTTSDTGGSGVAVRQYVWSQNGTTEPTSGWTDFTSGNEISKTNATGGNWYLWLKVIDTAGNRSDTKVSNVYTVKYQVLYDGNSPNGLTVSNVPGEQLKVHGTNLTLNSTAPSITGYIFKGWFNNASGTGTGINAGGSYTANAAVKFYAKWEPIKYTIAFNGNGSNGGSTASIKDVKYDEEKTLTENGFTRAYTITYNHNYSGSSNTSKTATYTFKNWNRKADGSGTSYVNKEKVKNLTSTNNDTVTLYAQWNSGSQTYVPTRSGYKFLGWYSEASCTNQIVGTSGKITPTANMTVYAGWQALTYTVEYHQGNGSSGSTKLGSSTHTYDVAKALNAYNGTAPTGWEFAGWSAVNSTSATTVTYKDKASVSNLTTTSNGTVKLYAIFKRTIRFNSGVSKATKTTAEQRYNPYKTSQVTSVNAPAPSVTNLSGTGWSALGYRYNTTATTATVAVTTAAVDVKPAYNQSTGSTTVDMYAVYSRTVTLYHGKAKASNSKPTQYYNTNGSVSSISAPAPSTTGLSTWTANGYRADTTAGSASYSVTTAAKDISPAYNVASTLYAVYSRALTMAYNGNGNSGGSTASHESNQWYNTNGGITGVTFTTKANGFTKNGYTFNKWANDSISGTQVAAGGNATEFKPGVDSTSLTKTMYALWNANSYTVEYHQGNGSSGSTKLGSSTHTYDVAKALTAYSGTAPTGWTFAGWGAVNSTSATTVSYENKASVKNLTTTSGGTVKLYAIFKRTIRFNSGVNKATKTTAEQRYNPYKTSQVTAVSAPAPSVTNLSGTDWSALGYRYDTSATTAAVTVKTSAANVTPAYNQSTGSTTVDMYAVYSRTVTIYHGKAKASNSKPTQYYNTNNSVSSISAPAPSTTNLSGWTARGYRANTTAGSAAYSVTTSAKDISPAYNVASTLYAVYSRALTMAYNGNGNSGGGTESHTETQWYNSNASVSTVTFTTKTNGFTKTGHVFSKWAKGSASGAQFAAGETVDFAPTVDKTGTGLTITMYAIWSANGYTVEYYQGNNSTTAGSTKISSMANTSHVYGTASNLRAYSGTAPSGWTFAGWSKTEAGTTVDLADKASVSTLATSGKVKLYAVFSKTIHVYSGTNKSKDNSQIQRYNPYKTDKVTSISLAVPETITNWTKKGYRKDTTAGSAAIAVTSSAGSDTPAYNVTPTYYAVYTRSYTANFYSGVSKEQTKTKASDTVYYNTNTASLPTTVSITTLAASDSKDITSWSEIGWRDDTTAGAAEVSYGSAKTVTFGTNFYSVYKRQLSVSYAKNGGSGTDITASTKDVYLNTNSTTTSSQVITLKSNTYTKTGFTFANWKIDSSTYNAGANYNPALAYNAGSYSKTAYAQWAGNVYEIKLNNNGGTTAGTTKIYEKYNTGYYLNNSSGTVSNQMTTSANGITLPTKTGCRFDGYYTSATGGTKYISGNGYLTSSASTTQFSATGTLYAHWTEMNYQEVEKTNTFYLTLQEALNGCTSGNTIKVLRTQTDASSSEDIILNSNKTVYLNLDAKLLTLADDYTIEIKSGSTLIINNSNGGKLIPLEGNTAIYNYGTLTIGGSVQLVSDRPGTMIGNYGTLNINGGYIATSKALYAVNGVFNGAGGKVFMTGGKIECTYDLSSGIYNAGSGSPEVTITGGTVIGGNSGIKIDSGKVTIGKNDGTVNSTETSYPQIIGDNDGIWFEEGELNFFDGVIKGSTDSSLYRHGDGVLYVPSGYKTQRVNKYGQEIMTLVLK